MCKCSLPLCKFYSHDESDIRKRVFELKGRIPEYVDHVDLMLTISHSKAQLHIFMEGNSKLTYKMHSNTLYVKRHLNNTLLKFIYSEKATKILTGTT